MATDNTSRGRMKATRSHPRLVVPVVPQLILALISVAHSFVPDLTTTTVQSKRIPVSAARTRILASSADKEPLLWNGQQKKKKSTRPPRYADYPDFAFTLNTVDGDDSSIPPVTVRYQENGNDEQSTKSSSTPQEVVYSVDAPVCDPNAGRPPWWLGAWDIGTDVFGFHIDFKGPRRLVIQEARQTRLRNERSYARREPFSKDRISVPPSLCDLSTPQISAWQTFWISAPARVLTFVGAYMAFPYIANFVVSFATMQPDQLDDITSKFGPGISILYGTFVSLTLSILYNRQRVIQDTVGIECSFLNVLVRNLLSLLADNDERLLEAGQCAADQIRTMVRSSRGKELVMVMYSDPYARFRELVDDHEQELFDNDDYDGRSNSLIANSRDTIKDLYRVRSMRLSDESLALPPTHFFILNLLTLLILLSYTVSIIPTVETMGAPSNESCLLFAVLSTIYVLFYNFASDLNDPFQGVYQIRRSCAATHLLQLKWLLTNHPSLRGKIDFEPADEDVNRIKSPDLGEFRFEQELYPLSSFQDPLSRRENL